MKKAAAPSREAQRGVKRTPAKGAAKGAAKGGQKAKHVKKTKVVEEKEVTEEEEAERKEEEVVIVSETVDIEVIDESATAGATNADDNGENTPPRARICSCFFFCVVLCVCVVFAACTRLTD